MVNDASDFFFYPDDLGFQRGDTRIELLDRKGIEVLAAERDEWIVGAPGQEIFRIHVPKVDPKRPGVNKPRAGLTERGTGVAKLPERMMAIDPAMAGGPDVLVPVERPVPTPGAGEYLIRVGRAGVNRPDVLQRKGHYPPPPGAPSNSWAGDRRHGRRGRARGRMARCSGSRCAHWCPGVVTPNIVSRPPGSACRCRRRSRWWKPQPFPETLFTVWSNLFERAYAIEDDTVLVHGGTSGIGTMAILLGKLFDLTVIVTCGCDEKCARRDGHRGGPCDQLPDAGFCRGGEADHRRKGRAGRCSTWWVATMCRATSPASPTTGGMSRSRSRAA